MFRFPDVFVQLVHKEKLNIMKRNLRRWIYATALLLCATGAMAKGYTAQGCLDQNGRVIEAVNDANLSQLVHAQKEGGQVQLHFNSTQSTGLTPNQRLFFFANECARARMGLLDVEEVTLEQAREADCRAVALLYHSGVVRSIDDLNATGGKMELSDEAWVFLPPPQRTVEVAGCLSQVSLYKDGGRLAALPTERVNSTAARSTSTDAVQTDGTVLTTQGLVHTPSWDRCVQGCSTPLYRCGKKSTSGPCYDRFNSCVAGCS